MSVVRMRVEISEPDGAIPGNYASQVVWRGSLSQWNDKVRALNRRARTMDLGDCDQPVTECEARADQGRFSYAWRAQRLATSLPRGLTESERTARSEQTCTARGREQSVNA